MHATGHARVDALLGELVPRMRGALGEKLVGVYLVGSLVVGDFDERLSDVDLVAALATEADEAGRERLRAMHDEVAARYPEWAGRIEVRYAPLAALNDPASEAHALLSISPGEPFHEVPSSVKWLMDWYFVRERGLPLHGPPPADLIAPIAREQFVACVREHALSWGEWIEHMRHRKAQAYAVLSLCRALYASRTGDQLSKIAAARWAQRELPGWSSLIERAVAWRAGPDDASPEDPATYAETVCFVQEVRATIAREGGRDRT